MAQPPYGGPPQGPPGPRPYGPYGAQPGPHTRDAREFGPAPRPDPQQRPAPEPEPIAAAPRSNRGCAVTAVVGAAVVLLLVVVGGVAGVVWLNATGGDYEAAPGCKVGETTALGALVPDHRSEIADPIDTKGQSQWWEGRQCAWVTPDKGSSVPASATLVMVRHQNRPGSGAEEEASKDLRRQSGDYSPKRLKGIGEEARTWFDDDQEQGCAGTRLSNLFVFACYTASTDFTAADLISDDEAIAGAEELLRATAEKVEKGRD